MPGLCPDDQEVLCGLRSAKKMAGQSPPFLQYLMWYKPLFCDQIDRSSLTALVHFQFKLELVAFFQSAHTGALYG